MDNITIFVLETGKAVEVNRSTATSMVSAGYATLDIPQPSPASAEQPRPVKSEK